MTTHYFRWCTRFDAAYPTLAHTLSALPYLSIKHRKILLAACRIQPIIQEGNRFVERYRPELFYHINLPPNARDYTSREVITLYRLLQNIQWVFRSPLVSSFLSIAVRSAPYLDYSSVVETLEQAIQKEMKAATCDPLEPLDFTPIVAEDDHYLWVRMKSNLPLDPRVHRLIRSCLEESKLQLRNTIFYPRTSTKTLGRECREYAQQVLDGVLTWRGTGVDCLEDVEGIYHEVGIELEGCVEMRWAWKYNDLGPRVYYAQGSTVYRVSKYVQAIFNIICDTIPICHRKNRYNLPIDHALDEQIRMFIYDYSSFTSRLTVITDFCAALAGFYKGTIIYVVDSREGPIPVDLGDLLTEFNEVCNMHPEFDVSRIFSLEEKESFYHSAGMLGVPGNITPCTMIHAIHIAIVVSSMYRCRCVGDDAFALIGLGEDEQYTWLETIDRLRNLGEISIEKTEFWDKDAHPDQDTWHYLKRPLSRYDDIIVRGILYDFPSLESLLDLSDNYHKSTIDRSLPSRQALFNKQWKRLLKRIHIQQPDIGQDDQEFMFLYYQTCRKELMIDRIAIQPSYSLHRMNTGWWAPIWTREDIGKDWVHLAYQEWRLEGRALVLKVPEIRYVFDDIYGVEGEGGVVRPLPRLRLMEKLGYLSMRVRFETYTLDPLRDRELMMVLISGDYRYCYDCTVVRDFPVWFNDLVTLEETPRFDR